MSLQRGLFLSCLFLAASHTVAAQTTDKKALFVIVDGIPADVLERVSTPHLDAVAASGGYTRATIGGEKGGYSQTPTISAPGYNTLLTGTWVNKHNVCGNSIEAPNYNYWTIFRFLNHQYPSKTAAIFSTWEDNRTKLVGAGLPETDGFTFDYYFDGFERDTIHFSHEPESGHIRRIDELVSTEAASYVKRAGPDLSWVYLQYTDDTGHRFGDGEEMDEAVTLADRQIGRIWEAIQNREQHHGEEWLMIVTTDHGRDESGHGHGGHSARERQVWIVTNSADTNAYFESGPTTVDILPSIARFMDITLPKSRAMELDGVSFIGPISASGLKVERASEPAARPMTQAVAASSQKVESEESDAWRLSWTAWSEDAKARVWIATTNAFEHGGSDDYLLVKEVEIKDEAAVIPLTGLKGGFYKVVLETPDGYLNYWVTAEQSRCAR